MTRPIKDQVVVITGASSGIGRATAHAFGSRGAKVVLAARSIPDLEETSLEVERAGGQAHVVATDVADWDQVQRLAQEAVDAFGRIDTWVNNAAVALYGEVEETTVEEIQRVIQVNLMGEIHGVKAALPHMKQQGGGTIINVASVLAERAVPLQAAYAASKHGIKGFTEALRMELEHEKSGVKVTLIEPSSVNTPFFNHARSKMGVMPAPVPPVYEAQVVAEAIVAAARRPRRKVVVGGAKGLTAIQRVSPRLVDRLMLQRGIMYRMQQTRRGDDGADNLFEPVEGSGRIEGEFGDKAFKTSPYTRYLDMYPNRMRALTAAMLVGAAAFVWAIGRKTASAENLHRQEICFIKNSSSDR